VLPLVQVAVAVALTTSNRLGPFSIADPTWTKPDRQFCDGLNAPAALIRFFLIRFADIWFPLYYPIEFVLETVVFFLLVGLLWYLVSIEIGGKGQSVLTPKTGIRRAADVLAIIFGAVLAVLGLFVRGQFGVVTAYSNLVAVPTFGEQQSPSFTLMICG
jgi:hypothetical protein